MIRIMAAVAGAVLVAFAMVEVLWAVPGHAGVVQSEVITVQGARHSLPLQGTVSKAFPFLDRAAGGPTTPPTTTPRVSRQPVTNPPAAPGCRVRYAANTWNNGFTANVTINNTGTTAVRGWRLQWAWLGKQQVASVWNATVTQAGTNMTARNASWNAAIAPGGGVRFGFQGTYGRTNATPTWFALNGTSCAIG